MKVTYDPYAHALYLRFNSLTTVGTTSIDKDIIMDYAQNKIPVGMEVLSVSKKVPKKQLGNLQFELNTQKPTELLAD